LIMHPFFPLALALPEKPVFKLALLAVCLTLLTACQAQPQPQPTNQPQPTTEPTPTPEPEPAPPWERDGWTLIWQDEFDGDALDPYRWVMEIGGHGWGNNEWQFYTDRPENVRLEDGMLVIEAREEEFVRRDYTSGRIKTQGLFSFQYGRVEARMKLPYGPGIWPAFWMLGEDINEVAWPRSGEIDIMEFIGREPNHVYGTVHGPGYSGGASIGHFTTFPDGSLAQEFHVFAVEWEPEEIRWLVDDREFFKLTPAQVRGDWVFDHPFFLVLNLAVGGYWPGYPDETTTFPQLYQIDYVRVYQTPEMAAEYQPLQTGAMHIGAIQVSAQEPVGDSWQALATITIVDQDGQPVPGVKVTGGWVGIVTKGEITALTDDTGTVNLLSAETERTGEVTFCVTSLSRSGYQYDKSANLRSCGKDER
jgi:beta-glucanase (GH16 family)